MSLWHMLTGISKSVEIPLLRVYRDVPVKDETTHDSEIDLSVEPRTSCDQATDEHDVISSTRKRRRLTHKSPRLRTFFLVILQRTMLCRFKQNVLRPPLSKILMRSELIVVGTIGATVF